MKEATFGIAYARYKHSVLSDIERLDRIKLPPFEKVRIDCTKLSEEYRQNLLASIIHKKSILYYMTVDADGYEIQGAVDSLKKRKRTKFKLPAVNYQNKSKVLYVGKTNDKFVDRIDQHLGFRSLGTYALHLRQWAPALQLKVNLFYTTLDLSSTELRFLEQIETVLHLELKPLLGRTGH